MNKKIEKNGHIIDTKSVLVLNSGGFDSVVLLHEIKKYYKEEPISLFFDYGQKNLCNERYCARKVANKLHIKHIEIKLPNFSWTTSTLCSNEIDGVDVKDQYVEYRNLIFLSYAISVAESLDVDTIYSALIDVDLNTYNDTNKLFIDNFTSFAENQGFHFKAPFQNLNKVVLGMMARQHKITREDFFSCNTPKLINGELVPCNECNDCIILNDVYEYIVDNNTPIKEWFNNNLIPSPKFENLFKDNPINEVRLLINNDCQFKCKHCFYGFTEMNEPIMSIKEFKNTIDESIKTLGEEINFHFSGKEPLFDEKIFVLAKYIKNNYPKATYDVVTNGVNVTKYIDKLKELNFNRVYLSVDSLHEVTIRPTNKNIMSAIQCIKESDIPLEIFIDVHKNNYKEVNSIIKCLHTQYNITSYYIRPVTPIGNGAHMQNIIVTPKEYNEVFKQLLEIKDTEDLEIQFSTRSPWTKYYLESDDLILGNYIRELIHSAINYVGCIELMPEFYCGCYENQITITPDGYVLGCATLVSTSNYPKYSSGNIKRETLEYMISKGKLDTLNRINTNIENGEYSMPSCYHCPYTLNK